VSLFTENLKVSILAILKLFSAANQVQVNACLILPTKVERDSSAIVIVVSVKFNTQPYYFSKEFNLINLQKN